MQPGNGAALAERLRRHRGNADVVRQELAAELGIAVSLRTVERAVSHLRREMAAEALATVRFETPPGRQLQIDFGQRRVAIEDEDPGRVFLFVATLGHSRRVREVADVRVHGTTGETQLARFEREERQALRPLNGRPPFQQLRELTRRVQNDACVDVITNHYSVPWRLIGAQGQHGGGRRTDPYPTCRDRGRLP